MKPDPAISELVARMQQGDQGAKDGLFAALYDELYRLARRYVADDSPRDSLHATTLLHETFVRLRENHELEADGRSHFFRIAAQAMRFVLVDRARARTAQKRGEGKRPEALRDSIELPSGHLVDVLTIDEALVELGRAKAVLARIVEMKLFGGFSEAEIASALGISLRTVERGWQTAKIWLADRLGTTA